MAAFRVDKTYYMPNRDLVVLAGAAESGVPQPEQQIDLCKTIGGPGWVPVFDVQHVPFAGGELKLCLVLQYDVFATVPLMEFSVLEGKSFSLRS